MATWTNSPQGEFGRRKATCGSVANAQTTAAAIRPLRSMTLLALTLPDIRTTQAMAIPIADAQSLSAASQGPSETAEASTRA
ncbi:MAG: hypothetical protein LKJ49_07090 [Olsenella sp.]|nr:hypothetical protein [Olsenella sp.]